MVIDGVKAVIGPIGAFRGEGRLGGGLDTPLTKRSKEPYSSPDPELRYVGRDPERPANAARAGRDS